MTTLAETPISSTARPRRSVRSLLTVNLYATIAAAVATEAFAAVVRAAGVHLAVGSFGGNASSVQAINAGACAFSIALCMVVATAFAVLVNRYAARPARTYVVVTTALVLVSLLAPLVAPDTSAATKLTLIAAHLIAAAIIVPIVARRLAGAR